MTVEDRLHLAPVRHHSPTAARHLLGWLDELRPAAVLVEGPSDYGRIRDLALDHQPPIALYSWVSGPDGRRRAATWPFCAWSPEWVAIRWGLDHGADTRFVDLPWAARYLGTAGEQPYADGALRARDYTRALCEATGADGFDALWDHLFESSTLDRKTWFAAADAYGANLRALELPDAYTLAREACMAWYARQALDTHPGPVLLVLGAYHGPGVREALASDVEAPDLGDLPALDGDGRGVALMPYTYAALDRLTGYDAGMPNPGFYDRVWNWTAADPAPWRSVLYAAADALRRRGQGPSTADLIAVETLARGLASLRGREVPFRTDLLDAVAGALVKESLDVAGDHPLLAEVRALLRGGERGRVSDQAPRALLVIDAHRRLQEVGVSLEPGGPLTVDLLDPAARLQSRILHSLALLEAPGIVLLGRPDPSAEDGAVVERWTVRWTLELEPALITASVWGPTVRAACRARLLDRAEQGPTDARQAIALVEGALLVGLGDLASEVWPLAVDHLERDGDVQRLVEAATTLLRLVRYDPMLREAHEIEAGALLGRAADRILWLVEQSPPDDEVGLRAIAFLVAVASRTPELAPDAFDAALERLGDTSRAGPATRGAALGARFTRGLMVPKGFAAFAEPRVLGDFLRGLFTLARAMLVRRPELIGWLDARVAGWTHDEFLEALPGLRLAFRHLSPRERELLVSGLLSAPTEPPIDDPTASRRMQELEAALIAVSDRYGLDP